MSRVLRQAGASTGRTADWGHGGLAVDEGTRAGRTAAYIIAAYLFAKMFYVASSGSAQPADIMLCLLVFFIVPANSILDFFKTQLLLVALVVWVALVNLVWFMTTDEPSFLLSTLYYLFNLIIVITFVGVRGRNPAIFDNIVCKAIMIAVAVETAVILFQRFSGFSALRAVGTFKNPNQLAYWGVVMLSLFVMLRRNRLRRSDLLVMGAGIFCEFASASRAGLGALIALLAVWLYFALGTGRKRIIACLSVIAAGVILALSPMMDSSVASASGQSAISTRINEETEVSQFDERQYNRIVDFYEYTIFGAGEGYVTRFTGDAKIHLEIHSSFGTMLFSYGIPGLSLFVLFLASVIRRLPVSLGIYLLPSLLYGVTHQGLRFTLFWGLIGAAISMGQERLVSRPVARPRPLHQQRGPEFLRAVRDASALDRNI
ncbi:hypothetical protein FHS79_002736 [Polymorphobacter multimanifer]|uniref:O-antigen ligase family protein n=1 Tax=Polymorphobacter multimanifer TaxID=1070431 RepID=A0A841L8N5_9SPHN|nr:hypothetical protein [Polymorphobacter multimanifer]MBB6228546.1 hypothetical protein [Polymorphobacter multimanifer]